MPLAEGELGLHERVAVLEAVVRVLEREQAELLARLEGPPWERSVRGRLHVIEAEGHASKAASAALAEAQAERRRARADREQAAQSTWSWRWKALAACTSVAVAVAPYFAIFYGH